MVQAPLKTASVQELAQLAIQRIKELGCEYGEIRLCTYRRQNLWAQDLSLKRLSDNESSGFGIRVLWQGSWGFAASHRKTPTEIERVVQLAVEIAKGSHLSQRQPVRLVPAEAYQDRYETPIELNPFEIPLTDKTALLLDVSKKLLNHKDLIKKAYAPEFDEVGHLVVGGGTVNGRVRVCSPRQKYDVYFCEPVLFFKTGGNQIFIKSWFFEHKSLKELMD